MMNEHENRTGATGVVLCGGQARRLGGVDKGLHVVAGRPLVDHVLERLRPQVNTVVISANRNRDEYAARGYPVVADESGNFEGPLAGVLAALRVCQSPWLVTAPCDAPHLPVDLVERLLAAAAADAAPTACAFDGERLQPTFCAYRADLAGALHDYLGSGERKIDRFLEDAGLARADFGGRGAEFVNLNSPADVSRFEAPGTGPG